MIYGPHVCRETQKSFAFCGCWLKFKMDALGWIGCHSMYSWWEVLTLFLRRWSVLFDSVLGRYMDINVSSVSFSLFHFYFFFSRELKTFPSLRCESLRVSYKLNHSMVKEHKYMYKDAGRVGVCV